MALEEFRRHCLSFVVPHQEGETWFVLEPQRKNIREKQYVLSCGIEAYSSHKMATNCVVLKFVFSAKSTEWRGENNLKILFAHFMAKKSQNSSMCF